MWQHAVLAVGDGSIVAFGMDAVAARTTCNRAARRPSMLPALSADKVP